jgi:PTS system mannose-specific IID component
MTLARRLFIRSFLIQALWNPRDFQGSGVGWALRETPGSFNGHPYLSGVALGALARLRETPGGENGGDLDTRFREALRAPLGALGDALVWVGLLPFSLLTASLLLLLGLPPIPVLMALLVGYNGVHLGLRAWGVRVGLRHGMGVGVALGAGGIHDWAQRLRRGGVVLAGAVTGVLLFRLVQYGGHGLEVGAPIPAELLILFLAVPACLAVGLLVFGGPRACSSPRLRQRIRIFPLGWTLLILWGLFALSFVNPPSV